MILSANLADPIYMIPEELEPGMHRWVGDPVSVPVSEDCTAISLPHLWESLVGHLPAEWRSSVGDLLEGISHGESAIEPIESQSRMQDTL